MATVVHETPSVALGTPAPKPTSIAGDQLEASLDAWSTGDDRVSAGVWECTPGTFRATREGFHEICTILAGSATITEEGGRPIRIGPGDLLVTPAGWRGTWEVHETLRKSWVIVRTA